MRPQQVTSGGFGAELRCLTPLLLLLLANCQSAASQELPSVRQIGCQFDSVYSGQASSRVNYLYVYSFVEKANQTQAVRLQVASPAASRDYPVLFVVRQQRSILSFQVPELLEGSHYAEVSRTLCPVEDASKGQLDKNQTIYIDVSSASRSPVAFTLNVTLVRDFQLQLDRDYSHTITPSRPKYYRASFPTGVRHLSIVAESDGPACMILSAQSVSCPVYDLVRNVEFTGEYQTMSTKAELTVERSSIRGDSFYIVFVLKPTGEHCSFTRLNELQPRVAPESGKAADAAAAAAAVAAAAAAAASTTAGTKLAAAATAGAPLTKSFSFRVSTSLDNDQYYLPVFGSIAFFACFHILAAVIICVHRRLEDRAGRHLGGGDGGGGGGGSCGLRDSESRERLNETASDSDDYGSTGNKSPSPTSPRHYRQLVAMTATKTTPTMTGGCKASRGESGDLDEEELSSSSEDAAERTPIVAEFGEAAAAATEAAAAAAAEDEEERPHRLYLSELCQKRPALLRNKYRLYYWYLIIVSIFYGLPVVQLVITYQQILRISGNQDICYYNFYCTRPLGVISAFNNVFSNIGYVALGLLFLGLTRRRDLINKRHRELLGEREENRGIPQHFGIFYAMGIALIMEGIMSGCYHVCPSYSNFQFDTAYMYVLAVLCMLKIYQTRHPDINASAHVGYMAMAIVIFVSVVGVVYGTSFFWAGFTVFFILSSLFLTGEVYYMGHWKVDVGLARRYYLLMSSQGVRCFRPMYKDRMAILAAANLINWSIAVYGAVSRPRDFNSFLLYIFLVNLLMYTAFYVVMKVRSGERIHLLPLLFIIMSCFTWGSGLYFFMQRPSNWALSPAESRALNRRCFLLDFYDVHDVWHFLSAMSLFFSFMGLMTLDDDLVNVSRHCIPVF